MVVIDGNFPLPHSAEGGTRGFVYSVYTRQSSATEPYPKRLIEIFLSLFLFYVYECLYICMCTMWVQCSQ